MKIGIDISQIVYRGTGTATYTANLVENLLKLDRKNEYVLFGGSFRQKKILVDFVAGLDHPVNAQAKLFNIPPTILDYLWNRRHILNVENLIGNVDLFHSSDWTQPPTKSKKVTTVHDLVVFKYPETLHPKIVNAHTQRLTWVKKECDLIIAVSENTKKDLVEILKIPEGKIRVIYEATNFKMPKERFRLDKPYLLSVGTREPRKNLARLVAAYNKINTKDIDLIIAGNYGWGVDVLDGIKILGYVPPEKLAELYSGAEALVYPSLYEGFGIPILEAFNCGCPVITSNVSSMPEVGGKATIYVDPLDVDDITEKINYVLDLRSSKRKTLIDLGFSQAQKFSWEKTAQKTIEAYESI